MATVLAGPARRRMPTRFRIYVPIAVFTLVVALYDWITRRIVHPVYVIGIVSSGSGRAQ